MFQAATLASKDRVPRKARGSAWNVSNGVRQRGAAISCGNLELSHASYRGFGVPNLLRNALATNPTGVEPLLWSVTLYCNI